MRRTLLELRAAGVDEQTEEDDLGELASAGQHPADVATETLEREVDLGLIEDFQEALEEIVAARLRVRAGRYGICERCGQSIDGARLEAVPATRYCRPCAGVAESGAVWRSHPERRAVLVSDEFLAHDDQLSVRDHRSPEELAVNVEPDGRFRPTASPEQ